MSDYLLLTAVLLPVVAGGAALLLRRGGAGALALAATAVNLPLAAWMFGKEHAFSWPWAGAAMDFSLRLYHFSGFVLLAAAGFALLVAVYSLPFMKNRPHSGQFYAYLLLSLGMANGAALADNLVLLLFFWEGLLGTLFGMIAIGRPGAFRTATKAFIIVGITDLCMMLGIAMTGYLAAQAGEARCLSLSAISQLNLPAVGMGAAAMVLLMIGAVSKAGSMPFHSWIPDAAMDAPLPFMAFLPASLEKLLGIYFLSRITLDLFHVSAGTWMSMLMMIVGAATILLAVMMALVQTNYKRLLSYHAISQVGYMVLGVGTALPIGIVGGLFHMINHAMYKSCLFLTAGAVERQAGQTDLARLGGLARRMPVTFGCFFIAAAAISGAPPLNGFFSKELIYSASMQSGVLFYLAAVLGTFLTAASFLKLGHAAYFGPARPEHSAVREAPAAMLVPMVIIAGMCVLFGVWNALPLNNLIEPIIGQRLEGHTFAGLLPHDWTLPTWALVALCGAALNHTAGARINGGALQAVDHIHHAPVLATIYRRADERWFDPYELLLKLAGALARLGWWVDRGVDWVFGGGAAALVAVLGSGIRRAHTGSYPLYVLWSLAGAVAIVAYLIWWS